MQQTTERPQAPPRAGFFRRILLRADHRIDPPEPTHAEPPAAPSTIVDLGEDLPATMWRTAVSGRLERLETGMFLVAQTMKRAFAQVFRSIEDLRRDRPGSEEQVERIVDDSLASLKAAVDDLAESIRQVPHILAAAADDIGARLENEPREPERQDDDPFRSISMTREPSAPSEPLPATPFDLEPVAEQFAPMEEDPAGPDARKIWGLEA
jgi:hypothetical protein